MLETATIVIRGETGKPQIDINVTYSPRPDNNELPDTAVGKAVALAINAIKDNAEDKPETA